MRYRPSIPNKRSILILAGISIPLALAAQDPLGGPVAPGAAAPAVVGSSGTEEPEAAPTAAEAVLDEAMIKVRGVESVAADVQVRAEMLNLKFRVVGNYLRAPGNRVLLRLSLEGLPDVSGTVLQVSDGATIKNYNQLLENQDMSIIRLEPLMKALEAPGLDAALKSDVLERVGFIGPETLMKGLRKSAKFDQVEEAELEGKPVFILRGHWSDRQAVGLPGGAGPGGTPRLAPFPPYVPSVIAIWVGRENGWPYKVTMQGKIPSILQGRDEPVLDPEGRPISRRNAQTRERPTTITLTYTPTDETVELSAFEFEAPPSVEAQDLTERVTADIEARIAEQATRRGAEGVGTLEESIPAPRPESGTEPAPAPPSVPAPESFPSRKPGS